MSILLVKLLNQFALLRRLGQTLDVRVELRQACVGGVLHVRLGGALAIDERVNGVGRRVGRHRFVQDLFGRHGLLALLFDKVCANVGGQLGRNVKDVGALGDHKADDAREILGGGVQRLRSEFLRANEMRCEECGQTVGGHFVATLVFDGFVEHFNDFFE